VRHGQARTPEAETERRRKISAARLGMTFSAEHRANISAAQRGKVVSATARANLSAALKGRQITWGDKISAAKTGQPAPLLRGPKPGRRIAVPAYRAAHARVVSDRGRAALQPCADGCGRAARHWSFNWRSVSRGRWLWTSGDEGVRPYSADSMDYSPRCVRCAHRYDSAGYGGA
jgi:hypothetical protein